jgi:hypothetical protein
MRTSDISDSDVLARLIERFKSPERAMGVLGQRAMTYYNWRDRGIPRSWRRTVWMICKSRGIKFDESWIDKPKSAAEVAACRRALKSFAVHNTNEGAGDGEAQATQGEEWQHGSTEGQARERRPATG